MMQKLWFAAAALLAISVAAQKTPDAAWVLTFSDDFDGKELSFPRWTPHDPFGRARNREGQAYVPEAVTVGDGLAKIVARRQIARYDGAEREFTSGIVTTVGSFAQMYGRFEVRCRVAGGPGVESKVWLLPVPAGEVPSVDIVDVVGSEPKRALFRNSWGDEKTERSYNGWAETPDLSAGFHTVGIEWDEKRIVWSVDGKETFTSVSGVPHQPMYLAANLAVGGLTAKYPDSTVAFPREFDIDSVRVYQRADRLKKF
jgi:beta-glucanase (GH16 family)